MTVIQQQCLLTYLGYSPGNIDGISGAKTQAAMSRFIADYGIGNLDADQQLQSLVAAVSGMLDRTEAAAFWDGITYFQRREFGCKCGKCGGFPVEPDTELVRLCDRIRAEAGAPCTVNSGIRCQEHNISVGGVSNSQHIYGTAADLHCATKNPRELYAIAERLMGNTGGIGIYSWGIHVDVRAVKSRWEG